MNTKNAEQVLRNRQMEKRLKDQSMRRQGLIADPQSVPQFKSNLEHALPQQLRPGNVGELNKVVWPFWFTFNPTELVPNSSGQSFITITQEAAFILLSISKTVFVKGVGPTYTYVDPNDFSANGDTDGLKFTLRDAQSTRVFQNLPLELDMIGHPEFPTVLPSPIMFLPNSTIEATYQNDNPSLTYVPMITFFGYRLRLDDPSLLSTVVG